MSKEKIKDGLGFIGAIKNWRDHKRFKEEISSLKAFQ